MRTCGCIGSTKEPERVQKYGGVYEEKKRLRKRLPQERDKREKEEERVSLNSALYIFMPHLLAGRP